MGSYWCGGGYPASWFLRGSAPITVITLLRRAMFWRVGSRSIGKQ